MLESPALPAAARNGSNGRQQFDAASTAVTAPRLDAAIFGPNVGFRTSLLILLLAFFFSQLLQDGAAIFVRRSGPAQVAVTSAKRLLQLSLHDLKLGDFLAYPFNF